MNCSWCFDGAIQFSSCRLPISLISSERRLANRLPSPVPILTRMWHFAAPNTAPPPSVLALVVQIDAASFLSSLVAVRALYPEDTTMLVTRQETTSSTSEGDEGAEEGKNGEGGGQGGAAAAVVAQESGVPFVDLKSFTTQAFFACWRGLHLGLLPVCSVCCVYHTLLVFSDVFRQALVCIRKARYKVRKRGVMFLPFGSTIMGL